ncbi:MAG: FAD-dependent oxidoreductase [Xanthomonadaceae bacterium]|nr:FAD-dependent oxidoreductase [Xanthomonadaceae bacterium]
MPTLDPSTPGNTRTCDFLVVGGGVVGLSSAVALAESGCRVTLVERAPGPGAESSGAAAGIVSLLYPWEYPQALQDLAAVSRDAYPAWCDALDAPVGWMEAGLLTFDGGHAPQSIARLDATAIAARAPAVAPPAATALWLPGVATLEPRRLAAALAARAATLGVHMRWGTVVRKLTVAAGTVTGVELDGGERLGAGAVLVAAGAWSAGLLASVGVRVEVRPVRGQVIELHGPAGLLDCVVMHGHRYLLPRADGRIVVGSTAEEAGFDSSTTADAAASLKAAASALVPATASLPVRAQWAGLRPGSPDGMPRIGPTPEIRGLWLNLGHFRNGITLAPGSAELLAALVTGRETRVSSAPFLPWAQHL